MADEVRVQLSEDGAGAERLDELTGFLRQELLELDVDDVTRLREGPAPEGARALDVVAIGGLLVSLSSSAGLRSVVSAVRKWLSRGDGTKRTVRMQIGDDVLELSEATVADQDRLVDLFVHRHSDRGGERWTADAAP